jgi:hypothetical protein
MGGTMVGFDGADASLSKMSKRFSDPRLTVTDEGNGAWHLRSSDFPSTRDDAKIIAVAKRLISVANGVMRQDDPLFFQPVSVRPMVVRDDETGKRTVSISIASAAVIATAETATVVETLSDGTTRVITPVSPAPPQPPLEDVALSLSGDDAVVKALDYYAYHDDWAGNLYKVYEIVGLDVAETKRGRKSTFGDNKDRFIQQGWDEIARQGWATREEATRFRGSVHSLRHAVPSKPAPTNGMAEDEAKVFIGNVLDTWLRKKMGDLS